MLGRTGWARWTTTTRASSTLSCPTSTCGSGSPQPSTSTTRCSRKWRSTPRVHTRACCCVPCCVLSLTGPRLFVIAAVCHRQEGRAAPPAEGAAHVHRQAHAPAQESQLRGRRPLGADLSAQGLGRHVAPDDRGPGRAGHARARRAGGPHQRLRQEGVRSLHLPQGQV